MAKDEVFALLINMIGTYFVIDAAINNKLVTLIAGIIFWILSVMAYGNSKKEK